MKLMEMCIPQLKAVEKVKCSLRLLKRKVKQFADSVQAVQESVAVDAQPVCRQIFVMHGQTVYFQSREILGTMFLVETVKLLNGRMKKRIRR